MKLLLIFILTLSCAQTGTRAGSKGNPGFNGTDGTDGTNGTDGTDMSIVSITTCSGDIHRTKYQWVQTEFSNGTFFISGSLHGSKYSATKWAMQPEELVIVDKGTFSADGTTLTLKNHRSHDTDICTTDDY